MRQRPFCISQIATVEAFLPHDVAGTVAVEIAGSQEVPATAGRDAGDGREGCGRVVVDRPIGGEAGGRVLEQDVRRAVAVEVAGPDHRPAGAFCEAHVEIVGADRHAVDDVEIEEIDVVAIGVAQQNVVVPLPVKSPVPISAQPELVAKPPRVE